MPRRTSPRADISTHSRLRRQRSPTKQTRRGTSLAPTHLILIGASAGGHTAIKEVIKGLSGDLPAAVILIRHLPVLPASKYGPMHHGDWLRDVAHMPIHVITETDSLESGVIYLTPPGTAVIVTGAGFNLTPYPEGTAPLTVINALFESAARAYGNRVIGVILTGMLRDGTLGLRAVHEAGGLTMVQSPRNAQYPDMPRNAMTNLPVTFSLDLAEIGPALDLLVRRTAGLETGLAISVRMLNDRVGLLVRLIHQSKGNDQTLEYLSAELMALKRYLKSIQTLLNDVEVDKNRCR